MVMTKNMGMIMPMAMISRRSAPPNKSTTSFSSCRRRKPLSLTCLSMKTETPLLNLSSSNHIRRSGNYEPTTWDFQFIQSTHNHYADDKYMKRFNELKKEINKKLMMMMMMVNEGSEELEKLELIDNLERLGVSYHFKDEIMQILRTINQHITSGDSLYNTALKFRLLRQHGFDISLDIFNDIKDENENLKQSICKDTKGLLELYEASFLSTENETTLKNATKFTATHLKNYVDQNQYCVTEDSKIMLELVVHALELPRHWMMPRLETEWYINIYNRIPNANPLLLEFAKLDFNIVQSTHQEDLRILSRWWKETRLAEKLSFSRDRLVEDFFWSVGLVFEPQHSLCRRMLTKNVAIIVVIDDIYDVYGTVDELEIFTNAVERWDIKAMEELPKYMKICYFSLFNTTNEMAYDILKEQGINVLPYLIKQWTDLCKAYLQEARWYYNGYKPTLKEYMDNAWISIAIPLVLFHAFIFVTNPITKDALESLNNYPDIIRRSAKIIRFIDDLGTSSEELKRGDVPKSIQCYMNEKNVSEEEARKHISILIKEMWEVVNKDQKEELVFSEEFIEIVLNFSRTTHCMYQHGDGHGVQNSHIKNQISKLFFEPMPITISIP